MPKRWIVKCTYKHMHGEEIETREIQEIGDAHDLVERGPDWRTLASLVIEPNPAYFTKKSA